MKKSPSEKYTMKQQAFLSENQKKLVENGSALFLVVLFFVILRSCAFAGKEYSEEFDIKKVGEVCTLRIGTSFHSGINSGGKGSSYQNTTTEYSWNMRLNIENIILARQDIQGYKSPIQVGGSRIEGGSYKHNQKYTGTVGNPNNPVLQNCEFEYNNMPDLCKVASIWGICDITENTKAHIERIKTPKQNDVLWEIEKGK